MTKEQKRLIDQYRQSGMKYSEIARTIGLPETTVKSYCYRYPQGQYAHSVESRSFPGNSGPAASALTPAGTNTG